jgi:hypothetical protein
VRHLVTFVIVTVSTAAGALWWLHDGDLRQIALALPGWDAPTLARDAGVPHDEVPFTAPDPEPAAEP